MGRKNNRNITKQKMQEPRINDEITVQGDVRVVMQDGENRTSSVMPISKAIAKAEKEGLDLIEISANANPPVLMIADYGKWLYDQKKKFKERSQTQSVLKEIQLTANIGPSDMEVKARKVKEFVDEGNKVKVVLRLKRREAERMEASKRSLYDFILMVADYAVPESMPKDEGNRSIVILKRK